MAGLQPPPPAMLLIAVSYFLLAGISIGLGYHRMLAHRSVRFPRWFERLIITLGLPAGTPIQWAGNHRQHHATTDLPGDPHSPIDGFWHAHVGWYLGTKQVLPCVLYALAGPLRTLFDGAWRPRTNQQHNKLAPDVAADPWFRFVSRPLPYLAFAVLHVGAWFGLAAWAWGLWGVALLWGLLVLIYNVGDGVDSVAHLVGDRPYPSALHRARNNRLLGLLALGDGWHANHHEFPHSARHGLLPGQLDWTWGVIKLLEWIGLARDIKLPAPGAVKARLGDTRRTGASQDNPRRAA